MGRIADVLNNTLNILLSERMVKMKKQPLPRVLFSCAGTTDPIRGEHDGPLLHIMRHYRPEKVLIFLTQEIHEKWQEIDCKNKMMAYLREKLDGYAPEIVIFSSDIADPSDLDALDRDMEKAFRECRQLLPASEILINVTSGTAQMQVILSQLALDARYHTRAIQVKNFERRAGTSMRMNDKKYDLDLEIEFNEDDQPGAQNRCVEPKMYPIHRNSQKAQILGLLEMRDFVALQNLKDSIPEELYPVVCHLAERSLLHANEAYRLSEDISEEQLGFTLYPVYEVPRGIPTDSPVSFRDAVEFAMLFRNLHKSGRHSEFLIRMEPMTRNLQVALADSLLRKNPAYRSDLDAFVDTDYNGVKKFNPDKLRSTFPTLFQQLQDSVNTELRRTDLSTYLMGKLIKCIGGAPEPCTELFNLYDNVKEDRNLAAHELTAFSEADFCSATGRSVDEVIRIIERATAAVFPQCDPARFNVYDKCVKYIKDNL